jgi:hypothetical protein
MKARVTLVFALSLLTSACATPSGDDGDLDAAVPFDGTFLGKCSSEDYVMIPATDCLGTACLGSEAFALCEGTSYARCVCAPPGADWTLIDSGSLDARVQAGPDAGHLDGGGSHS